MAGVSVWEERKVDAKAHYSRCLAAMQIGGKECKGLQTLKLGVGASQVQKW